MILALERRFRGSDPDYWKVATMSLSSRIGRDGLMFR